MEWYDTVCHELSSKMIHFLFLMFCASPGSAMPDKMEEDSYIIGGKNTNITEVPYQAAVYVNGNFICGGIIVSDKYLLTAAHCIGRDYEYTVRVGSSFRYKEGVIHKIKRVAKHPSYSRARLDYDIGFLEVEDRIEFNANAQPIPVTDVEPQKGDTAKISGYGKDDIYHIPDQLQSGQVLVMDRKECNDEYENNVTQRMICTISKDHKTCPYRGDSGGPVVVNGKVVGAVSWGNIPVPCNFPTVYSNFADPDLRKFIKENTGV